MCLDRVTRKLTPGTLVESGYKVFGELSGGKCFEHYALGGHAEVPLDAWITAEEQALRDYTSGFHIYVDEEQGFGKTRVYYRRAHTLGTQGERTVVVAREMYVPSRPNAWPPK